MNERLTELYRAARSKEALASQDKFQSANVLLGTEIEKFSELMIREGVKVMYDNAIERKVPPDIVQTPTHYAIAVLKHFGVEQ